MKLDQMLRLLFKLSKRSTIDLINGLFGDSFVYEDVLAIRYWQWSPQDLRKNRMYALLPLQVFKARKQIRSISDSGKPEDVKRRLIERCFADLKEVVRQTVAMITNLHDQRILPTRDMDRMLRAMSTILNYLYKNYGEPYQQTEKEVFVLIKSFYDPEIRKQGRE